MAVRGLLHAHIAQRIFSRHSFEMKSIIISLIILGLALPVLALDRAGLDNRIGKVNILLQEMQLKPDKSIPAQDLRNAQGIILLDRTKAGFIFAYQGGSGVAMVREPNSGQWGPPAFVKASEASFGVQAGGQHSFVVILLMNTNSTRMLTEPVFKFGGEAGGTAGNASGGVEGGVASVEQLVLVFSDTAGLYGGAAIKGASISPDTEANLTYYGQFLTTKEILYDGKVKPSEAALALAKKLDELAKQFLTK